MSNIDNITQKILADAKAKAEEIANESKQVVDELLAESHVRAQSQSQRIIEKATEEAAHNKAKIISNAKIKARDEALVAKQAVLGKVFALAQDKLAQLTDYEFGNFLKKTLSSLQLKGNETLVLPQNRVDFVKNLGLNIPIDEEKFVDSGFQLQDGQTILNYSFSDLVDNIKSEMEGEISKRIFPEEA